MASDPVFDIAITVDVRAASRRIAWDRLEAEVAPALLPGPVEDLWLPRRDELEENGRAGWLQGTLTLRVHARTVAEARAHVNDDVLRVANSRPGFRATAAVLERDRRHAARVRPPRYVAARRRGHAASLE